MKQIFFISRSGKFWYHSLYHLTSLVSVFFLLFVCFPLPVSLTGQVFSSISLFISMLIFFFLFCFVFSSLCSSSARLIFFYLWHLFISCFRVYVRCFLTCNNKSFRVLYQLCACVSLTLLLLPFSVTSWFSFRFVVFSRFDTTSHSGYSEIVRYIFATYR